MKGRTSIQKQTVSLMRRRIKGDQTIDLLLREQFPKDAAVYDRSEDLNTGLDVARNGKRVKAIVAQKPGQLAVRFVSQGHPLDSAESVPFDDFKNQGQSVIQFHQETKLLAELDTGSDVEAIFFTSLLMAAMAEKPK